MLRWAAVFMAIAIIAGILWCSGIIAAASEAAKVVFYVFLAVSVMLLVSSVVNRGQHRP
ncbi:DUF1328 domain-containing protein [bacterium]|nr:DUF1328 domain-containing protein [bacterium]